ncbi:hypothetical protein LTR66_006503 [Elasticomyces elasticus]|nr:hypothetical protein LTR66_006503 [Elasticomyces elasticus]
MAAPGVLALAEVTETLLNLDDAPAAKKATGYNDLLTRILVDSAPDVLAANLIAYLESALSDSVGIVTSRPLLANFAENFRKVEDPEITVEVGTRAIQLIAPKVVSFEEQDTRIKEILAEAYEKQEDYVSSAKVLQTITLDSSQRSVSDDDKARVWIRITRCYLEVDDPINALTYLNRVKTVLYHVTDQATRLQFLLSQARVSDAQRNFIDASTTYHTLSTETMIDEGERMQALSAAIVCAILAPAGPKRSRQLGRLYKDDRASQLEEYGILEKIFLDRLLRPEEVKAFAEKLQPHQLAKTADGSTVLDKAVLEHNLLGASRLYSNIRVPDLGTLLGVDSEKAEQYAAQMIEQGRLAGYIDQIDQLIFFEGEGSGEKIAQGASGGAGKELRKWDTNVQGLAEEVERITTMIQSAYPEFYEQHMVH